MAFAWILCLITFCYQKKPNLQIKGILLTSTTEKLDQTIQAFIYALQVCTLFIGQKWFCGKITPAEKSVGPKNIFFKNCNLW
mgnify:CR=1 FL=1